MNPSHSSTFSITEPLRNPSKAAGASSDRSSGGRASDSFNSIYHSETASFDNEKQTKDININSLREENDRQKDASNTANTQLRAEENEGALVVDESTSPGDTDGTPAPAENDLAREDQSFETELLHGISVTLPSSSSQTKVGEMLPPGGKEWPPGGEHSEQKSLLTDPTAEPELGEVLTRADTQIEIPVRSNANERSDRLRQSKVVDLNSTRSDPSMNEHRLEIAQSKVLSEALTESLALLTSKSLQDPATALTTGNNSLTNLSAVVSQIDSTAAQKLSLVADAAANTDLNASARSSNFDRSNVLGEKIHWMRNANISTAELHLHPADLGSIEITIVTEDQQARVSFITSSATARDVIEESLPKLRELLADSGLALDQSDISQKESGDEPAQKNQQALPENPDVQREIKRELTSSPISSRIGHVDHYV
jgi:flagellar hook-length control protein FliK